MLERLGDIIEEAREVFIDTFSRFFRFVTQNQGMITIFDHAKFIVILVVVAVVFRSFVVLPYRIDSGSMMGTLLINDYYYVSKFSYGYSRYSTPFEIIRADGRLFGSMPERGDVAVFKLPTDNYTDYIKRVIGLPGDRIRVRAGVLYLNNEMVPRVRVEDFVGLNNDGEEIAVRQYRETLPNGVTYLTLDTMPRSDGDFTEEYVVPEGHFFMMGDNRDNSLDSRFLDDVGYVPYENLVGRASIRFFSTDGSAAIWQVWRWPSAIRWERLFGRV